ncbi:E3 ubiquitin-protein ligase PRT6 [Citrus sinensis]|nr:E3 ubiquitin-protein ligase PRT6 [Citrus sinensis]
MTGFHDYVNNGDCAVVADELDSYLDEKVISRMEDFNILSWWKTNANRYPTLARIARNILAISITTVASESAFSTNGRVVSSYRKKLHPSTLEALMCCQTKLGSGSSRLRECLGSCGDWLVRYWRSASDSSSETETDIMEIDSPPDFSPPKPRDRIVRRLINIGVPEEFLDYSGIVNFAKNDKSRIPELVSTILPPDEEVAEVIQDAKAKNKKVSVGPNMKGRFRESMLWLQWLMFEREPEKVLRKLSKIGQRGVCGAVWGNNDIAYRCRTCEHDPTCAICVPCFQNGNHKEHDYSIIYTGGGCCDCGDVTAWKREGFCSRHKGAEQIQPLPEKYANSAAPVLDALFIYWENKLSLAESVGQENPRASDHVAERRKLANELTFAVVEMLLEFCKNSESLLSFVSKRVISVIGLLDILVRAERFSSDVVVRKLHELLLKLLGEPIFKYEFAKVFLSYYPVFVKDAIREHSDDTIKKYPLLSTFSVQIFTVPTLTPRLVKEMNLLEMLLGCLREIFDSCAGDDSCLQVAKWANLYETTNRVIGDIRFVMSHAAVSKYATHEQLNISKAWMKLLTFVQGMNPQKRETGIHIREENEYMHLPLVLDHSIANIQPLLVDGAFSSAVAEETRYDFSMYKQDIGDGDSLRHAKVGRLSQESSVCGAMGRSSLSASTLKADDVIFDAVSDVLLPHSVTWLAHECLRAMENWLGVDDRSVSVNDILSPNASRISGSNFVALKKTLSKIKKGKSIFSRLAGSSEVTAGIQESGDLDNATSMGKESKITISGERDTASWRSAGFNDSEMEGECATELDNLHVLSLCYWPDITYDVSSQDVSVHIPLHRLLSLIIQKALRRCYGESAASESADTGAENPLSAVSLDFFGHILGGCHPYGFSAFVMEHPLRIRVFCAQVHAGMWRRNGDAALSSCEWYRAVRWSEQGLELDLFLLQCCAALAPADLYEPILVQEMLTLIIQILQERRFCGLTTAESLKRELVHRLAIGDATHSQLVKSLPRDLSKFDQLQEILDAVAMYSHPSGFNQGMYSLRWSYWKELDIYHPRWSSRDLQVAEERYLRFCSVSALTAQLPRWTKIYYPLESIAGIATCKVVLQVIRAVLFYAVFTDNPTDSRAPYGVLLTALHLLALALDVCFQKKKSGDQSCDIGGSTPILDFASEEIAEGLNNGAGKQSLLSLLVFLMGMYKKDGADNFLEAGNCNLSSVIESLLKKFAEIDSRCMTKLQQLAPEIVSHLSQSLPRDDTSGSFSASDSEKRKAKARERQAAILEKMKAEQFKFLSSISSNIEDAPKSAPEVTNYDAEHVSEESVQDVCALCHDPNSRTPVSYLILLQKSRLLSFVDRGSPSWDQDQWLGKECGTISANNMVNQFGTNTPSSALGVISSCQLAQVAEEAVNQFAYNGKPEEVNAVLEFVKAQFPSLRNIPIPFTFSNGRKCTASSMEMFEQDLYLSICREMRKNMTYPDLMKEDEECSVAEGGLKNRGNSDSFLLGKYVASISKEMRENASASEVSRGDRIAAESLVYDGFGPIDCDGIHLSSCGHAVHQGCLDRYVSSLKERQVLPTTEGNLILLLNARDLLITWLFSISQDDLLENVDKVLEWAILIGFALLCFLFESFHYGEFLCPVCRQLANSVLPALPWDLQRINEQPTVSGVGLSLDSNSSFTTREENTSLQLQQAVSLLQSASNVVGKADVIESFPLLKNEIMASNVEAVSRRMCKMYFQNKLDKFFGSARVNPSLIMWDALKYSLMSMEIAARSEKTSTTPIYDVNALDKELKSSSGFVLSLLLKVVQSMRSKNSLHVLQRFRGIQLFAESICSGTSIDNPGGRCKRGGTCPVTSIPLHVIFLRVVLFVPCNMLSILKHADVEVSYPDIQFWNRASDPVLARDPFSSLMWVLFCLPCQFILCKESLLSLVHVFYAVTLSQAVLSCCGKLQSKVNELGFSDSLISDISKLLGEFGSAQEYFVSNYIDPSCDIKDMIRRLSFPYLRRCALLWKLLNSTVPPPFSDRDHVLARSSHGISDMMDSSDDALSDLKEIQEVEKMFKIPSLDVILKDEVLRSLVLKWFHHFSKEFEVHRFQHVLYSTPAVPFKLMCLPHLYQDLLQSVALIASLFLMNLLCACYVVDYVPQAGSHAAGEQLYSYFYNSSIAYFYLEGKAVVKAMQWPVVLRTTILLQRCARQAPWPSPYLDAFGEEDIEMHRGKPLYLNEERYAALTYMGKKMVLRNPKIAKLLVFNFMENKLRILDAGALQIFISLNLNEFGVHRRSAAGKYTSSAPLNGCTVICKA